jgi:uncharacterized protein (TIGR03437 family)
MQQRKSVNTRGYEMSQDVKMKKRMFSFAPALLLMLGIWPLAGQTITTLAGNGTAGFSGDLQNATAASLNSPKGLAIGANGTVFIADENNWRIRAVSPQGVISTVAGNGSNTFSGDGAQATTAGFSDVLSVVVDSSGNLYVADPSNRRIRKISSSGIVTTIAGIGTEGYTGDGGQATSAEIGRPTALALDPAGNLYFTDSSPFAMRVRRIATNGIITTVAGNGVTSFGGDGLQATSAALNFPLGIAFDSAGNYYIADAGNNRVRKVSTAGVITTAAGTGSAAFSGDGGQATAAALNLPSDVVVDLSGNLYIADAGNNRIRKVDTTGIITTIAGTGTGGFSGDNGNPSTAGLNHPWGLTIDANGALYIADDLNNRVRVISGTPPAQPVLPASSAVNAASFAKNQAVAPGAYVAVFGSNFSTGVIQASTTPLPTLLGNTSVTVNGVAAPLYFVSPTQINIQIPFNAPTGNVNLQVTRGGLQSAVQPLTVSTYSPGIFMLGSSTTQGIVVHTSDFSLVTNSSPARPGEYLGVYATGLGPLDTPIQAGQPAPGDSLIRTLQNPVVTLGNTTPAITFSGLAPTLVAVYQVNIQVPTNMAPGNYTLTFASGGIVSNTATVPVSQ